MSEKELQKSCIEILVQLNIPYIHLDFFKGRSVCTANTKGYPDLTIYLKGSPIFIELKSSTGKLKPEQEKWKNKLESLGYVYFVIKDLRDFTDKLTFCFECSKVERL